MSGRTSEILHADVQRLSEVFNREGVTGLKAFIDTRVGMQLPAERILMLADSSLHRIAGNLPQWPQTVPQQPGLYTVTLDLGGKPTESVVLRSALPDGYNLLVGRDVARFAPLTRHFWTGLGGAMLASRAVDSLLFGVSHLDPLTYASVTALLLAVAVAGTGFCLVGANNTLNAYTATLYPTDIRSTAVGWGGSFGRFVGGLGPYFGGILLHELPLATVFVVFAIPALCGALAVFALQRTRLTPPPLLAAKASVGG